MTGIRIDAGGRVLCYGNPAGYVNGDRAVEDPLFQTDELSAFLEKQRFKTIWRDGTYDHLFLGGGSEARASPLKDCRVWQLRPGTPFGLRFIPYADSLARFGTPCVSNYAVVYDGQVETNELEALFEKFSAVESPPGYSGYPLSMSDLVELYDEGGSIFYYCDRFGFQLLDLSQQNQSG